MRFAIVTPALNGVRYIDEAILSVVTQVGPFTIRYHVQDGGSTDGTVEKLERWRARLEGTFPTLCERVEFTYDSSRDGGMYDAVARGFAICGEADAMSWINTDDRYEPSAFIAAGQILQAFGDVEWLSGRVLGIDESGAISDDAAPVCAFPRAAIAAGIFDARHADRFVQQPGTFWRSRLWRTVRGLDSRLRFAGDFNLWRRFAGHADLVSVDAIFSAHRRHKDQLTAEMAGYYAEIDASLSDAEAAARAAMTERYWRGFFAEHSRDEALRCRVMRLGTRGWACENEYVPLRSREMQAIYSSTSWRLTAPLRAIVNCWRSDRRRRYRPSRHNAASAP